MSHQQQVDQKKPRIRLRQVAKEDCEQIYSWRNHPETRRYFLDPAEIPWESHQSWFEGLLRDNNRQMFIAYDENAALGVLRFDLSGEGKVAEIDIYVVPGMAGRGIGSMILEEGLRWLKTNTSVGIARATVMTENRASRKLFENAHFEARYCVMELELNRSGSS